MPGGHIPNGFWVMWEGPPYRPHSLGDGSECRRGKGLKTVCLAPTHTSVGRYGGLIWNNFGLMEVDAQAVFPLNTSEIISDGKYIPHSQSPLNVSVHIYIPHSHSKENVCARWRNANSLQENVVCDCH